VIKQAGFFPVTSREVGVHFSNTRVQCCVFMERFLCDTVLLWIAGVNALKICVQCPGKEGPIYPHHDFTKQLPLVPSGDLSSRGIFRGLPMVCVLVKRWCNAEEMWRFVVFL